MNRYGEALWPPLVESLPAVLTREVAWSWRLDTRPMVDRDAPRRLVIVCCDVMHWSSASRPSQPVITHRRGDRKIANTATDAQLTGCMGQVVPLLARWSTAHLVHPAVLVPAELVGYRDARRGALDVVLCLYPALRCDLQRVLPIQRLVVGPLPVALGFWRPRRRAAPLVELKLGGARVPRVFKRPDDRLCERVIRVASPLLPPVLDAPVLEDPVVLEGVYPVLLVEGDLFEEITPDVLVVHAIFHEAIAHLEAARQVPQDAGRLRRGTSVTRQDGPEARREDHERHPPDGADEEQRPVAPARDDPAQRAQLRLHEEVTLPAGPGRRHGACPYTGGNSRASASVGDSWATR
jgi:hypothetical protein